MPVKVEAHESFGAVLRHFRMQAKLSLSDMQSKVFFSKSHLSKVENGLKAPSVELARRCDEILKTGGALNALVRRPTEHRSQVRRQPMRDQSWPQPNGPREILGFEWNSEIDPLDAWRSILGDLRRAGQKSGPLAVIPIASAAVDSVSAIACGLPSTRQVEALILASRFSIYAGWMKQEAGDDHGAVQSTERAVELAEAAGDNELAAYAMVRRGLMALYNNEAEQTIHLARRAQAIGNDPRILGLAAQREAQGHAMNGDSYACMAAIDQAHGHFAQAPDQSDRALIIGTATVADPAAMVTGWCLYDLGEPRGAAEVLAAELGRVPIDAQRSRARWGARLALSLAGSREVEQACHVVEPVLRSAPMIDSATIRKDLRKLNAALRRWDSHPQVRRIAPALTAVSTGQI